MMKDHGRLMDSYAQNYENMLRKRSDQIRHRIESVINNRQFTLIEAQSQPTLTNWKDIKQQAAARTQDSCSICMCSLFPQSKPLLLTSCGHIYHAACLTSFETFTDSRNHKCPNCRSSYDKKAYE